MAPLMPWLPYLDRLDAPDLQPDEPSAHRHSMAPQRRMASTGQSRIRIQSEESDSAMRRA